MSILGPALAVAVGVVLAMAGLAHLRRPASLMSAVRAHRVLPVSLVPPRLLGLLETGLGSGLVIAAGIGAVGAVRLLSGAAALLLTVMTAYLVSARRRQQTSGAPDLPCGCGVGEAPLGVAVVARTGGLVLAAATAVVTASSWSVLTRPPAEVAVAVCAGLTLAVVLALLPAARVAVPVEAVAR